MCIHNKCCVFIKHVPHLLPPHFTSLLLLLKVEIQWELVSDDNNSNSKTKLLIGHKIQQKLLLRQNKKHHILRGKKAQRRDVGR